LFIFHIPNEWNDLDLFNYFALQKIGKILSVRVMTDKKEGRSRGFGFVSYETKEQAREAIKKINGKSVLGKRLKVELK
jgi:RNA recognition motif-containing protein